MPLARTRAPDEVAAGVARWLAAQRGAEVAVRSVAQPSEGLSNETLLLEVEVDGRSEALAVRLPPLGPGLSPEYDLPPPPRPARGCSPRTTPPPRPELSRSPPTLVCRPPCPPRWSTTTAGWGRRS